jgi:hypothetical protein
MPLPTLEQYLSILETREQGVLSHLRDYQFLRTDSGDGKEFFFRHGTSAAVFKAVKGGKHYAVRLFLRDEPQIFKRYEEVSDYLSGKRFFWKLDFTYLPREIIIGDKGYPAVIMDWAEGLHLNHFIDEAVYSHSTLSRLQEKLVELVSSLEENKIGHGDLKFDNLIIQKQANDFSISLVDYDSMYVPALEGEKNLEPGSPGYQHPRRLASNFSETMDRFSVWVMLTALEAIKEDSSLWTDPSQIGYKPERNLLFTLKDFINPTNSKLFQKLKSYNNPALNFYTENLIRFCQIQHLNSIEKPVLFEEQVLSKLVKQENKELDKQEIREPVKQVTPEPVKEEIKLQEDVIVVQPKVEPKTETPVREVLHEAEIKSVPPGKDLLLRGVKKGITPLKLSLAKADFDFVEIRDENEKVKVPVNDQITSYEINLPKKELPVIQKPAEQDEIIEFTADRYSATEGELATINWKVKGDGKIHISNIGEVAEKAGRKRIVLNNTAKYVLTVGSKKRALTIKVQPKKTEPKTEHPEPKIGQLITKAKTNLHIKERVTRPASQLSKKWIVPAAIVIAIGGLSFLGYQVLSGEKQSGGYLTQQTNTAKIGLVPQEASAVYTEANVTEFLRKLYSAYNKRDLKAILGSYNNSLTEYYDSSNLSKASLIPILDDLFLTPQTYSCKPDYSSLKIEPLGNNCKVTVNVVEKIRYDVSSKTESYNSTIEYTLDPSLKIIAEKHGS